MIQGIWMWPNNIYEQGAEKIVSSLKCAGFTDIYFLTKGLSGKTSHHGKHAPHAFSRDLLKEVIASAHVRGIRVHAWFTSASDEYYKSVFPESGRAHIKRGKDRELISFKSVEYRDYLKRIIDEVVENYPVDGIHLDYIRYNHMLYGWDEEDISSYVALGADRQTLYSWIDRTFFCDQKCETAFDAYRNGDATLKAFSEARKNDVNRFARHMLDGLRGKRASLILSAAVMPEGAYEDHAFSDLHYGQVYEELSPLFDYLIPMAYTKAYDKTSEWISDIGKNLTRQSIPFAMGIQAYDHVTGESVKNDFERAKHFPDGVVLFREGACAIVCNDHGLKIFNDTDDTVSLVELFEGARNQTLYCEIMPGEIMPVSLSFVPDKILLYSGTEPVPVFYNKSNC